MREDNVTLNFNFVSRPSRLALHVLEFRAQDAGFCQTSLMPNT